MSNEWSAIIAIATSLTTFFSLLALFRLERQKTDQRRRPSVPRARCESGIVGHNET